MAYHLTPRVVKALKRNLRQLDPQIADVIAEVRPDHTGEDVLALLVVLKDEFPLDGRSLKIGQRLNSIAYELRQRAAKLGVDLYTSVRFVPESELEELLHPA